MPLLSLKSRQWVGTLKMQGGSARCAEWAPGGNLLLTLGAPSRPPALARSPPTARSPRRAHDHGALLAPTRALPAARACACVRACVPAGGDGVVHTWDVRTQRCLYQLRDHANIGPSALRVSPDGKHLATGSVSGVVNLYPGPASPAFAQLCAAPAARTGRGGLGGGVASALPSKEVLNLVTTVDSLEFSHDSQLLAFSSRMKRDAMRLLHVASRTVFSNWPTSR